MLITFHAETDGNGLEWHDPKVCVSPNQKPAGNVVLVTEGSLPGYKLGPLKEWQKRFKRHAERYPDDWGPKANGICVEITKFVRKTNAALG